MQRSTPPSFPASAKTGIGARAPHLRELIVNKRSSTPYGVGFLEAHPENYLHGNSSGGGSAHAALLELADHYPISLHGVGLSLGSADGLNIPHLDALKSLIGEVNPVLVSEHLSWSRFNHIQVPDLLPVPYTTEALDIFVEHIDAMQQHLQRQILIENPSNYLAFADLEYTEPEFLTLIAERTNCGLLIDVNNIAVSAHNLDQDPQAYIDALPADGTVQEIHLAGYDISQIDDTIRLDTHGRVVQPDVWDLYEYTLAHLGDVPTLMEWDTDIPDLDVLVGEAKKADQYREKYQNVLQAAE